MMMIWNLCGEWSKGEIPEDLGTEILSRLPVKSLLRFRSVSKSWLALIDDADFAHFHLNNFRNNSDETHLLVLPDCEVRSSETFNPYSGAICSPRVGVESFHKQLLEDDFDADAILEFACSVDGLLLLTRTSDSCRRYPDFVWNPSIRKLRKLPSLPNVDASLNSYYDANGLGYDRLAKAYKIVKLIFVNGLESQTLHSVAIFTLGGNSWKIMKFPDVGRFNWHWTSRSFYPHGLYFQGCLYFVATATDLVCFELSSEVFSSISLPDVGCLDGCQELAVVDAGCTMAAFCSSPLECFVWVLDTESMNWTKRSTCQLYWYKVLYFKSNGDILARRRWSENNDEPENAEEENLWWIQVVSYSPKTDEYKIVHKDRDSILSMSNVFGYVQSLILHN